MRRVARADLIVVVTSVGTEEQALDIAHALVRSRRAACVNLIPNVHSVYRWKGRVCDDGELLLIIKTRASSFDAVRETIHKVNTYELPEVLAYRVDGASPGFASWIGKMTVGSKRAVAGKRRATGAQKSRASGARKSRASGANRSLAPQARAGAPRPRERRTRRQRARAR